MSDLVDKLRLTADGRNASAPLRPQRLEELVWLGLPEQTAAMLQPYVTVLPGHAPVNLNTASAEVIYASIDGLSLEDAQRLVAARKRTALDSVGSAARTLGLQESALATGQVGIGSRFFEVRARLRSGQSVIQGRTVLQRDGLDVRTLESDPRARK